MTTSTRRAAKRVLVAASLVGAYVLGRTDGTELSGYAYLVGAAIVAFLCVVFYALGWDHRSDEEERIEAERQILRDAAERNREGGSAATGFAGGLATLLVFAYLGYTFAW